MNILESRYLLSVTLSQLDELKRVLETASVNEADPDAPVFELLEMVRKVRTDAVLLKQRNQQRAADVLARHLPGARRPE